MTKPTLPTDNDLATIREMDRIIWSIAKTYKARMANMRTKFMELHSLKADLYLAENYPEHEQNTTGARQEVVKLQVKVDVASQEYDTAVAEAVSNARTLKAKLVPSN